MAGSEAFIDGSSLTVTDMPDKSDGPSVEFENPDIGGSEYPTGTTRHPVPKPAPTVGRP